MSEVFVGVDVSQAQLNVSLRPAGTLLSYPNTCAGIRAQTATVAGLPLVGMGAVPTANPASPCHTR